MSTKTEKLFSYGTLQLETVQLATFGRKLTGTPDTLIGYRLSTLQVKDPEVVALSGTNTHLILTPTDDENAEINGMVFDITTEEILAADEYEVADYKRVSAQLRSGESAWVYVNAQD